MTDEREPSREVDLARQVMAAHAFQLPTDTLWMAPTLGTCAAPSDPSGARGLILHPGARGQLSFAPQLDIYPVALFVYSGNGMMVRDVRLGKNSQLVSSAALPCSVLNRILPHATAPIRLASTHQ